jgi:excisionase family DNA binding protein
MSDGLLTAREVAKILRISDESVYRLCRKGRLKATRVGGLWRIPRESVDQLLQREAPESLNTTPAGDNV